MNYLNWAIFLFGLCVIIAHLIMSESIPIYVVFLAWLNGFLLAVITNKKIKVYVSLTKATKECQ